MDTDAMSKRNLSNLPQRPPVNIEFQDLSYVVPQGRKGSKFILRNLNGQFRSGHLHAIMGPSGAGKSTLLNVLAGYKTLGASGTININGEPRNMKKFRKLSRYIMQEDLLQPMLTVQEAMMVAADLKLSRSLTKQDKLKTIREILEMLRLKSIENTITNKLSGGERKRVSIALELLNNPPVIFLDEPTTGLDDMSSFQCISLLKMLAEGGRTVICSIHAPSSRLFAKFDNVYIVSAGQCMFQGFGQEIIPFLSGIGLSCPTHYNPADFIIEVASGDYGSEFVEKMVIAIENGRNFEFSKSIVRFEDVPLDNNKDFGDIVITATQNCFSPYKRDCSIWYQFTVLLRRFWIQAFRDLNYLILKIILYTVLGVILGGFYLNMGQDGSKTLFNFGYCYTSAIAFLYLPLMPVLLNYPLQIQLVKREHFNQWYGVTAYYLALSMTTLPLQTILNLPYIGISYVMSDQPLEFQRIVMFVLICTLTSFNSESLGLLISSVLGIVNGMFLGPCLAVPIMLLAVYGIGQGSNIPLLIKTVMHFSYLRYTMEGLVVAIYGNGRPILPCPEEEDICILRDPKFLMSFMGMGNIGFAVNVIALFAFFLLFRLSSFYLLRQRLRPNKTFVALQLIGKIVKSHFSITH